MGTFKKAAMLISALVVLSISSMFAADTGWTRINYTSSTTFVGYISGEEYVTGAQAGDSIGAFVGDECRMIAVLFKSPISDTLFVSSVIHGGGINPKDDPEPVSNDSETVTFKLWKQSGDVVDLAGDTLTYPGSDIFMYALGRTSVALSDTATLTEITVDGTPIKGFDAATTEYTVEVQQGTDLSKVTVDATTTDADATIAIDPATDFVSDSVAKITVTAEDNKTEIIYTVTFVQKAVVCNVDAPTVPTEDVNTCSGVDVDVVAEGAENATFEWLDSDNKVASTDATLTTKIAGQYTVTQTVGECTSSASTVTVVVVGDQPITFTNPLSSQLCSAEVVDLADLGASPSGGVYAGTGIIGNETDGFKLDAEAVGVGTNKEITYTYSVGECTVKSDLTFDVLATPQAPDLSDAKIKTDETVPALEFTPETNAVVVWKDGNGDVITGAESGTYTPSVDNAIDSVYTFYVTQEVGTCVSEETAVRLTVTSCSTDAPAVENANETVCAGDQVSFEATLGDQAITVSWKDASESEISSDNPFTPSTDTKGTYIYYVSATPTAGGCEGPQTKVTLVVNEVPKASITIPSENLKADGEAVAITVGTTVGTVTLSGTGVSDGKFDPAVAGTGTFTLKATADNKGCIDEATGKITVDPVTTDPAKALKDAIAAAKLLDATQGYNKGEYIDADGAETALATAISTAEGYTSSTDETELKSALTALEEAVKAFEDAANPVDYRALKAAIDAADAKLATIGDNTGTNVDGKYQTAEVEALKTAKSDGEDLIANRETSATAVGNKADDITTKTDIAPYQEPADPAEALKAKIAAAKLLSATQGYDKGEYIDADGAETALGTAIATAEGYTSSTDETELKSALKALEDAVQAFEDAANPVDYRALKAAIDEADAKLAAIGDNTGTNEEGKYQIAEVEALKTAKSEGEDLIAERETSATTVGNKTDDITAKTDISAYVNPAQALQDAINEAKKLSATQGYNKGEYIDDKTADEDLATAISAAEQFLDSSDEDALKKALEDLQVAVKAFEDAANPIDYRALKNAIDAAEAKVDEIGTNTGTNEDGKYQATDVATLNAAINDGYYLFGSSDQDAVTQMASDITNKTDFGVYQSGELNLEALKKAIENAEDEIESEDVIYSQEAIAELEDAIADAKDALALTNQGDVDKAAGVIEDALANFKKNGVLDLDDINKAIADAKDLYNETPNGNDPGEIDDKYSDDLWDAISDAKKAVRAAESKDAIADALSTLNKEIKTFKSNINPEEGVGVEDVDGAIAVFPTIATESITISGLAGESTITVTSTLGVVVFQTTTQAKEAIIYTSELATGTNLVTIVTEEGTVTATVIVK